MDGWIITLQPCLHINQQTPHNNISMSDNRDYQKIGQDKTILKELEPGETIILSAMVIKVNHVEKKQERIILVTSKNVYNILPQDGFHSFLSNFMQGARIKRKIPYSRISGVTMSRHGPEFVLHVENEHDYRFSSTNLKMKIVQAITEGYCNVIKKKMALYYNDDKTLETFTTTIKDLEAGQRKKHMENPQYIEPEIMNTSKEDQKLGESTLIFKSTSTTSNITNFHEFELKKVLGKGAFGKVMLCQLKGTNEYYAVKSMRKEYLIDQEHLEKTRTERKILELAQHPFLINLEYAFQSKDKVFFVMKFLRGGELFKHLKKFKKFDQDQTKFYAAQVYLALAYLHDHNYIYRDLKPENILMDVDGYIKVSDYGLAKEVPKGGKTHSFVGTPEYVAPEVILKIGHGAPVDWWAFGTLIYEMLSGGPPFYNKDHGKMLQGIVKRPLFLDLNSKQAWSKQVQDLITKLLMKNPQDRIGTKDHTQIKNHPWFKDMNWQKLIKKQIVPDFIPTIGSQLDVSNFDERTTEENPLNSYQQVDNLLMQKHQKDFEGMSFIPGMN